MDIVLLSVTYPDRGAALNAVTSLLESKLVACGNLIESASTDVWKGEVRKDDETIAIFKTTKERSAAAKEAILSSHPYDIPCVLELPADANAAYAEWVRDCVK